MRRSFSEDDLDAYLQTWMERNFQKRLEPFFQGLIMAVVVNPDPRRAGYFCQIQRTGDSVVDTNTYLSVNPGYIPQLGDLVECMWRDNHTGYVLWELSPRQHGAGGDLQFAGHLLAQQTKTPVASNLGANVTSVTFTGNDTRGKIVIVMAGALAANTRIATCTYGDTYSPIIPLPALINETSGVGLAVTDFYSGAESITAFDLFCDQALAAGTYTIRYLNVG